MTAEQAANKMLQERGYFVVGCQHDKSAQLPYVLDGASGALGDIDHPLVLIAVTDFADLCAQAELLGLGKQHLPSRAIFYRAVAE